MAAAQLAAEQASELAQTEQAAELAQAEQTSELVAAQAQAVEQAQAEQAVEQAAGKAAERAAEEAAECEAEAAAERAAEEAQAEQDRLLFAVRVAQAAKAATAVEAAAATKVQAARRGHADRALVAEMKGHAASKADNAARANQVAQQAAKAKAEVEAEAWEVLFPAMLRPPSTAASAAAAAAIGKEARAKPLEEIGELAEKMRHVEACTPRRMSNETVTLSDGASSTSASSNASEFSPSPPLALSRARVGAAVAVVAEKEPSGHVQYVQASGHAPQYSEPCGHVQSRAVASGGTDPTPSAMPRVAASLPPSSAHASLFASPAPPGSAGLFHHTASASPSFFERADFGSFFAELASTTAPSDGLAPAATPTPTPPRAPNPAAHRSPPHRMPTAHRTPPSQPRYPPASQPVAWEQAPTPTQTPPSTHRRPPSLKPTSRVASTARTEGLGGFESAVVSAYESAEGGFQSSSADGRSPGGLPGGLPGGFEALAAEGLERAAASGAVSSAEYARGAVSSEVAFSQPSAESWTARHAALLAGGCSTLSTRPDENPVYPHHRRYYRAAPPAPSAPPPASEEEAKVEPRARSARHPGAPRGGIGGSADGIWFTPSLNALGLCGAPNDAAPSATTASRQRLEARVAAEEHAAAQAEVVRRSALSRRGRHPTLINARRAALEEARRLDAADRAVRLARRAEAEAEEARRAEVARLAAMEQALRAEEARVSQTSATDCH